MHRHFKRGASVACLSKAACRRPVQMLDEVKRMLIMTEKVHSCTYPNCGRTFATPGNLRDHENEHR